MLSVTWPKVQTLVELNRELKKLYMALSEKWNLHMQVSYGLNLLDLQWV